MASSQKRGLGRGLDALFVDNAAEESGSSSGTSLRLADIQPDRSQPRCKFDEQALEELASSIREHGVLQPIVVRPCADSGGYKIVAGERRWRAARLAGLTSIPAVIRDLSDTEAMELALIENLQREDLDPIEEAEGYRALMDKCDYTQEQAAQRLGKSRPAVANALRLLSLPEPVLELLRTGKLSAGHAKAVLSIPDDAARVTAAESIAKNNLSVREAEKFCSRRPKQEKLPLPGSGRDPVAQEVELSLKQSLGVEVKVDYDSGRGKLTVSFYSKDQLFDFANRLGQTKK